MRFSGKRAADLGYASAVFPFIDMLAGSFMDAP
jgi:hypothetical protein